MKAFTIEQIRNYLKSQDSFGDALYNLSEDKIELANAVPNVINHINAFDDTEKEYIISIIELAEEKGYLKEKSVTEILDVVKDWKEEGEQGESLLMSFQYM